jgi:hypothetical protein
MSSHQIRTFKKKQLFTNELETFELEIFIETHIENIKQLISCPICWDVVKSVKQHFQCCHILCNDCDQNVMRLQQKCPICRQCWICSTENCICNDEDEDDDETYTDHDPEIQHIDYFDFDAETTDYVIIPGDNLEIPTFQGTNEIPTTNLFPGRRWYNADMKQVSYYLEGQWFDEKLYMDNPLHFAAETSFAIKLITGINQDNTFGFDPKLNCKICGIQRTTEVNTYIINDIRFVKFYYRSNSFIDGSLHTDNYCWGTNAFDGNTINYCFNCYCVRDTLLTSIPTY